MISKIKAAYRIYKDTNKVKLFTTIRTIKNEYGFYGLKTAILNKLNGRPYLSGVNGTSGLSYLFDFNKIGNEIFEKQQNEITAEEAKIKIDGMKKKPLISIIMPIYNPSMKFLEKAVKSLQAQFYENWELCAVDDGSRDCALIEKITLNDRRAFLARLDKNGGISTASNLSLEMAHGEFIALMDQDDEITPDALFWFANEINNYPDTDFIYSDECKIGTSFANDRTDFYFKPDWSPALLINHMYTGHLTMYRTALVKKVGGFRSEFDFSQDYDLALRISDMTKNIRHIERVLYFWRMHPSSGAGGGKEFARKSNLMALGDWFKRQGLNAMIEKKPVANYGSIVMEINPKVSFIIPTDSFENLRQCVDGLIMNTSYKNVEIIPVTNSKVACEILNEYPYMNCLKVCLYDNFFNFSDKCNEGAKMANGDILVFYNDDVTPRTIDWVERLIEVLFHDKVGGVSPMMVYENGTIQYAGMTTGVPGIIGTTFNGLDFETANTGAFNHLLVRDVSVLCGACIFIKKQIFDEISGFNAVNTPSGHSDLDLSLNLLEKGYRCVYTPYAVMTHLGNHSWTAKNKADKADIYCLKRWGQYIGRDPYFTASMKKMFYMDFTYPYEIHSSDNMVVPTGSTSKDILFVTHELSRTGAPSVLKDMVKILLDEGNFPVVLSPVDGSLRQEFLDMGVTVIIDESFIHGHWMFERFARNFDLVVINTLICAKAVELLKNSLPPILWWIHEGEYALKHCQHILPCKLGKKVKIYTVSDYATDILKNAGIKYKCDKFTWGVPNIENRPPIHNGDDKVVFVIVGSLEKRKGQDIVIQAIEKLDAKYISRAEFIFAGNSLDKKMYELILESAEKFQYVSYLGILTREEIFKLYGKATCVIIASRDEPLSVVAIEAMVFSKTVICSDRTGITQYITNGHDGLVFPSEDAEELAQKIKFIIDHPEIVLRMGQSARKIYEKNFTMTHYRENVNRIMKTMEEI